MLIDEGMQFYESDCKVYAGRGNGMLGLLSRVCTSVFLFHKLSRVRECRTGTAQPSCESAGHSAARLQSQDPNVKIV